MNLPKKGQPVTVDELIQLAIHYDKLDIVATLSTDPPEDIFVSDGCSLFPDQIFRYDLYPACFWHDVRYWCGVIGDDYGRIYADTELCRDVTLVAGSSVARAMFIGVSVGGLDTPADWSFEWGYGRQK